MRLMTSALISLLALSGPASSTDASQFATGSVDSGQPYVTLRHPAWTRDAVTYQMSLRQFTKEGTFVAAARDLPRLQRLGVDIIWLMPIHPIGVQARLGTLGSPYSVRDYRTVNPEFGTMEDMKAFVAAAHKLGLHVILDWVDNHSARDNPLTVQHPDWYEKDWKGDFRPATWVTWSDIIDFDYSKPAMRRYMTEAMKFWVAEADVDGFRADYAGGVPLDFWENARAEVEDIKPVFMLAEWEYPDLHRRAFDATYAWRLVQAMKDVAAGRSNVGAINDYFGLQDNAWPREGYRLAFTSNHDVNLSEGTDSELFGPALRSMIALTFIADTMPMIYNGQETASSKRLNFLTKDPIEWKNDSIYEYYNMLIRMKKNNPSLHNGQFGGRMVPVATNLPGQIFSFMREKAKNKVLALFNFSGSNQNVQFSDNQVQGKYKGMDGNSVILSNDSRIGLKPWEYRVFIAN
jgi:glycosidase